jgi:hypothetical protein
MEVIFLMLLLVCSMSILGMIMHHNLILLFSCFCNKVSFKPMFCKLHILVFDFLVYLDLKLTLPLSWLVCVFWNSLYLDNFCVHNTMLVLMNKEDVTNVKLDVYLLFKFPFWILCLNFWCTNYIMVNHVCNWMTQGHGYIILSNICENFL